MPKGPQGRKRAGLIRNLLQSRPDQFGDIGDIVKLIEEWEAQS
jgi:hypothetical protein